MKITHKLAVAIFVGLQFPKATSWDDATLNKRLAKVSEHADEFNEKDADDETKKAFAAVVKANEANEAVTVEPNPDAKPAVAAKGGKASKPAAKGGKANTKPAKGKDGAKATEPKEASVDAFGNRVGSHAAEVNCHITKTAQTTEQIFAKVSAEAKKDGLKLIRVIKQCRKLTRLKKIAKTEDKKYHLL